MSGFEGIARAHMARWPGMEPRDFGKLAFQSEFGPEHLVTDRERVLNYLEEEWAQLTHRDPVMPPEDIGNGLCRFHLSACGREDLPRLAEAFCRSAAEHRGTRAGLDARLAVLRELDVPGMEEWLAEYEAAGCPPVRHSESYRAAHRPHYRVLTWAQARELDKG